MLRTRSDDRASEVGIGTLTAVLDVTAPISCKLGFRKISLCVRFIICLKKIRAPPPVRQVSRTASSRSYVAVDVDEEGEEDERESKKQLLRRIVREKDRDAFEEFGGVTAAISLFDSESEGVANDGMRLLVRRRRFWHFLWQSLNSYTVFFLLVAAGLSFAIGSLEQGSKHGWHDGVAILVAVVMLVLVPPISHLVHEYKEQKLLKNKNLKASVKRGGIWRPVSVSDVMVGDLVYLTKGDPVPADGLLIDGGFLILDEVINTKIDTDQNPFLLSGSVIKDGAGVMIVISTGAHTAMGEGLLNLTDNPFHKTLLQSWIDKPYAFIDNLALAVSLLIALVVLIRLLCRNLDDYYNDKPETKLKMTMSQMMNTFGRIFLRSEGRVSVLVHVLVAIVMGMQNGMPFAITASLCFWEKMVRSSEGSSQNISACGTMGRVSTVCIDITGGQLIHNVEVGAFFVGEEDINRHTKPITNQTILEVLEQATSVAFLDPKTSVCLNTDLLISWANKRLALNIEPLSKKFNIIDHKKLGSKKCIGALISKSGNGESNLHLHYHGDASMIVNMCSHYYDIGGSIYDIENHKVSIEKVIDDMIIKGLRPIAFACKQTNHQEFEEDGLSLLGFVGLKYSCQEIKTAVEDLKRVGVRIILISEDDISSATSMAYDLRIFQCGTNKMEVIGEEVRKMMKDAVEEKIQKMKLITVMGKAISEDKLLLVKGLQESGHVVAFWGGLTTGDAPALRKADVGVTQKNRSTQMSQKVSDITVVSAGSLAPIVRYGRCAYLNIQKFYRLQLTAAISGLLITLISTMSSGGSPITTFHMIWAALIMCLLGGLMMVMELNDDKVETPLEGDRNQSLVTKGMVKQVVMQVLYQALLFLLLEYVGQKFPLPGMDDDVRHTMIFNMFILCQIFNLFDAMELVKRMEVFKAVLHKYWFLISLVGIMSLQVVVIEFFGAIVNCVRLSSGQWAICFLFGSLTLTLEWALNIFPLMIAALFSALETTDSQFIFIFTASLMFVVSLS